MSAQLLPFPLARRVDFVRRHARAMTTCKPAKATSYLEHQLDVQAGTMERRGFADDVIGRELNALKGAVQAEVWRLVMRQDGAA